MADKQLSLKQDADDNLFADDDPLAALARIASFEPQGETRPKPFSARRAPVDQTPRPEQGLTGFSPLTGLAIVYE